MSQEVLYPVKLEMFRLVPLGDPPYYTPDEACSQYEDGNPLSVLPQVSPPQWSLTISSQQYRFTVKYLTPTGTPLRVATWERRGDDLLCVRMVDLFYPDGDPAGHVPFADVVAVTRRLYTDGVADIVIAAPIDVDDCQVVTQVPLDGWRMGLPEFGDWAPLIRAAEPPLANRCGLEALDEAQALAKRWSAEGVARPDAGDGPAAGWRTPLTPLNILVAADEIIDGYPSEETPVISRGAATIIPLFVQAGPDGGERDLGEERRRRDDVAADVTAALEGREGIGAPVDLAHRQRGDESTYGAALAAAGATRAVSWCRGSRHALVLVSSGDEDAGPLTLALHVVLVSWATGRGSAFAKAGVDLAWSPRSLLL